MLSIKHFFALLRSTSNKVFTTEIYLPRIKNENKKAEYYIKSIRKFKDRYEDPFSNINSGNWILNNEGINMLESILGYLINPKLYK